MCNHDQVTNSHRKTAVAAQHSVVRNQHGPSSRASKRKSKTHIFVLAHVDSERTLGQSIPDNNSLHKTANSHHIDTVSQRAPDCYTQTAVSPQIKGGKANISIVCLLAMGSHHHMWRPHRRRVRALCAKEAVQCDIGSPDIFAKRRRTALEPTGESANKQQKQTKRGWGTKSQERIIIAIQFNKKTRHHQQGGHRDTRHIVAKKGGGHRAFIIQNKAWGGD